MPDRKPLISGNWKMHHNHFEAIAMVQKLSYNLTAADYSAVDVSVHPPFTDLRSIQTIIDADKLDLLLGAQHCHWEEKGAFTGEVAPAMLAKLQVSYVIAGHSERRELFGETDEDVNRKVKAHPAGGNDPDPVLRRDARGARGGDDRGQGRPPGPGRARRGQAGCQVGDLVIAYEPIWAIGTGRTATPEDAQSVCAHVRSVVKDAFGAAAAAAVRIQYGGSVKPNNAPDLMAQPDIDGALVGGACLDPDDFARIVQYRLTD